MARIPYPDPSKAPDGVREALAGLPQLNIFRMLAHAETAFRPFLRFGGAVLSELQLDPRLRELAILQVAAQAGARYERVQHAAIARHLGVTDEQIAAVERGDPTACSLSEIERAVLQFSAEVLEGPRVSDPTFAEVSERLSPREIVELLLTVGEYLMLARVMTTLELELELELDDAAGGQVVDASRGRAS